MPEATPDDWEEMQEMLDSPYDSDSPEWVQNFEPRPTCPSWLLEGDIDPSFFGLNDEETLEEIVEYTGRRFPWRLLPAAGDC